MGQRFTNFAETTIVGTVAPGDTTITVAVGTGALFPITTGSVPYFFCVLQDSLTTPTRREVIKVASRAGDVFSGITRAQDGTTAQAWTIGQFFALRLTRSSMEDIVNYTARDVSGAVTGAVATTKENKFNEIISVKDFGALGTGSGDDTGAINAAINYVNTAAIGPVRLVFPQGTYRCTGSLGTITANYTTVSGYGAAINLESPTGTGILFNGPSFCTIEGLAFYSNGYSAGVTPGAGVRSSGGYAIKAISCNNFKVKDCEISGQYQAIIVEVFSYHYILDTHCNDCILGVSSVSNGDGLFITNCRFAYQTAFPLYKPASQAISLCPNANNAQTAILGGVRLTDVEVTCHEKALNIAPTQSGTGVSQAAYVFLSNTGFDTCAYGIYAVGGASKTVGGIVADAACWFSSCLTPTAFSGVGGNGIFMQNVTWTAFSGCTVFNNKGYGAWFDTCTNIQFNGGAVINNNTDNVAAIGGINTINCTNFEAVGTAFSNISLGGASSNQKNGVTINGTDEVKFIGCNFFALGTSSVLYTTIPSKIVVKDCLRNGSYVYAVVANNLTPDTIDDTIHTGAGTINDFPATKIPNKRITVICDGAVTWNNSGNTVLNGQFIGVANSIITLVCNGTVWVEESRSTAGITVPGNLTFTGTGRFITGDFTNATASLRTSIQSSTVNGATIVNVLPNGTGTTGAFNAYNASDPANSTIAQFAIDNTNTVLIRNNAAGTGTFGDISFQTDGTTERLRIVKTTGSSKYSNRVQLKQGATVASANDLTLGSDGNRFQISGSTQINRLSNTDWQGGSEVTLHFQAAVTVKHNQAAGGAFVQIMLAGSVDFVAAINGRITLQYDSVDSKWYEVARTIA